MIEVELVNGRGVALVDDVDADLIVGRRWYLANGYALASSGRPFMHRLILAAPPRVQVDHINRDKLDNRRANLRLATSRENKGNVGLRADNTSGFKGVSWDARCSRWRANIGVDRCIRFLGRFDSAEAAARAYDGAAVEVFGEFASLNFPTV